jgi:hypothetical protein
MTAMSLKAAFPSPLGPSQRNRDEAHIRDRAFALLPDEESAYCSEGYIPKGWSDGGAITILIETILGEQDNSRSPRPHYE